MCKLYCSWVLIFGISICSPALGQQDSAKTSNIHLVKKKKKIYQTGLFKASILPAALIGYGVSTIHGHGIYSSYDAYRDIQKLNFKGTSVDDYLQYAPYAELVLLNLFKIKCRNDFINTGLLIIKSQILMTAIVFPLKSITHIVRPDSANPARERSFPSGHTANAFVAASIVHKEYKHKSSWYGVGAYTIAASVGIFRMLNNRHWESDVFVGAGIGMLSVHLVYLTHRYKWGRNMCLIPSYQGGNIGLTCYYRL
jgi:membrane-associated phospholipid phosphatase